MRPWHSPSDAGRGVVLQVFLHDRLVLEVPVQGTMEIGRQQRGEPEPFAVVDTEGGQRAVVAPWHERSVPRHLLLVRVTDGAVAVSNIHQGLWVALDGQRTLGPGQQLVLETDTPATIELPAGVKIKLAVAADSGTFLAQTFTPASWPTAEAEFAAAVPGMPVSLPHMMSLDRGADSGKAAVELVRLALTVVQQSIGSDAYFEAAARAVAEAVELDRAMVVLQENEQWRVAAQYVRGEGLRAAEAAEPFSRTLLQRMTRTRQTEIYIPQGVAGDMRASLAGLNRGVASPILDERGRVIGAICGDRRGDTGNRGAISSLEAALVELIAGAVAAGLARSREEQSRARLTQFFSARVADRLQGDPRLLEGQDADVTVLFCDVRGFSRVTEKLGAEKTICWVNDLLTELSDCVLRHDGVLVDYVGDELMAMWGAPGEQPDHAARALAATVDMLRLVEPLRDRWGDLLPTRFGFGIGINTGRARVGNTGSRVKFKYGPLGNTVNLGSRIQGATRHFHVAALAAASTVEAACAVTPLRRLSAVAVVGIEQPVQLYEVVHEASPQWLQLAKEYEAALESFEAACFGEAVQRLGALVRHHPEDGPSLLLLSRAVEMLVHPSQPFDPVYRLQHK